MVNKLKNKIIYILFLPRVKYPETCLHIELARLKGQPYILTLTKSKKLIRKNRRLSTSQLPTKHGYDRDEYPLACTYEGGTNADVKYISPHDNRGAGACLGNP